MNRLTSHNPDERLLVISANALSWNEIYDRLTQYEDTEFEPAEIEKARQAMRSALALACELQACRDAAERGGNSPCSLCGYGGKYLDAPPCVGCPAHPKKQPIPVPPGAESDS